MLTPEPRSKLLVFAEGSADGGGSGFRELVKASRRRNGLWTGIVGVVSSKEFGGVSKLAKTLGITFYHFSPKPGINEYQRLAMETGADFFALSGWLKLVSGLDPTTRFNSRNVFNIHPGPLPRFGGKGMYGHHVHKAVIEAFERGEITDTEVNMHFVTEKYDEGPEFFKYHIAILPEDTAETLGKRVNAVEHREQWRITNLVVKDLITWNGANPESLSLPPGYEINQYES